MIVQTVENVGYFLLISADFNVLSSDRSTRCDVVGSGEESAISVVLQRLFQQYISHILILLPVSVNLEQLL